MTSLTGSSGGGWTLVMKTDGRKVWNKSDIKADSTNGSSRDAKLFSLTAYSYVEMKSFFLLNVYGLTIVFMKKNYVLPC